MFVLPFGEPDRPKSLPVQADGRTDSISLLLYIIGRNVRTVFSVGRKCTSQQRSPRRSSVFRTPAAGCSLNPTGTTGLDLTAFPVVGNLQTGAQRDLWTARGYLRETFACNKTGQVRINIIRSKVFFSCNTSAANGGKKTEKERERKAWNNRLFVTNLKPSCIVTDVFVVVKKKIRFE